MATLWIDPSFGASGDMLLGAIGAHLSGAERDLSALDTLDIGTYSVTWTSAIRNGLSSERAIVETATHESHKSWSSIDRQLASAELPDPVKAGARATFRRLGEIEAAQHGVDLDDVHFHEVGAADAIVDIVGVWLLVDRLAPDRIIVGPVGLGHGTVVAAHGTLPLPAPATAALLVGSPVTSLDVAAETCTPTGAALLVTLADEWGALPSGVLGQTHRGAGGRNPETHPNVVTTTLVEVNTSKIDTSKIDASSIDGGTGVDAVVIEANLDDVTGEVLGHTIEVLLAAGADDAWVQPITMKKGRPGHLLGTLCRPELVDELRHVISAETGSLGTRVRQVVKHPLPRSFGVVEIRGHEIAIKAGPHRAKPEHDDLVAVSAATGVPIRVLAEEALAAWATPALDDDAVERTH